jgi:hypothetical protein
MIELESPDVLAANRAQSTLQCQRQEMPSSSNFVVEVVRMFFRSRIRVALFLATLCGLIAWIACCGSGSSSSSGGPTPTPTPNLPAHSVSISWQVSSSPGVVTYNVYRSTTSGGPYTRVGWRVSGASFTDMGVQPGATYFYVVTSVTSSNVESVISSEVKTTVPSP